MPFGNEVVVIARTAFTWMVSCAVAVCGAGTEVSVPFTVNVLLPVVVGAPVMAPVAAFSIRPAGSEPTEMLQVTGGVPPAVVSVAL